MILTFDEACERVDARQAYLDSICLDGTAISEVSYVYGKPYDHFTPDGWSYLIAKTLPTRAIQVFLHAFEKGDTHRREDDFLSTILDHEGFHVNTIAEHPRSEVVFSFLDNIYVDYEISSEEVLAYEHQLSNPFRRNLSLEYVVLIRSNLERYRKLNRQHRNRLEGLKK